jgi:CRP-like cAMP-binding protein
MSTSAATARLAFEVVKTACSNCNLRELCLPIGLEREDLKKLDELVSTRRRLKRGDYLYRAGQGFESIYAVRSGFFKTDVLIEDGRDQVTGFQMTGELLGSTASAAKSTPVTPSRSKTAKCARFRSRISKGCRGRSIPCSITSTR